MLRIIREADGRPGLHFPHPAAFVAAASVAAAAAAAAAVAVVAAAVCRLGRMLTRTDADSDGC
jgi:hypothetical protein